MPILLSKLLKHDKVNVNLQDNRGRSACLGHAPNGHQDIFVELLKHYKMCKSLTGASTMDNGNRSLIDAAGEGRLLDVQNLLQKGANVNSTNDFHETALMIASKRGHFHVVVQLLNCDEVDVNHRRYIWNHSPDVGLR
jgi:ankyrin repeat protein